MKNKNLKLYIVIGICLIAVCSAVKLLVDNKKEDNLDTRTTTQTTTQIITTEESTTTKETSSKTTSTTDTVIFTTPEIIDKVVIPAEDIESDSSDQSDYLSLGKFKLTAYCKCSKCCGKWAGSPTASGTTPKANRTIAVDPNIISFGTKVVINGNTYVAEDSGSAIKGNRIDIYMPTHSQALDFGVQYAEVFVER
jgi:3D (Asp-Asp-Asp) domain-containing protein